MKHLYCFLIFLLGIHAGLQSQNLLNKPEHIAWDAVHEKYLVTNYGNGKIISIDQEGNQEAIIEGISSCLGIHIVDTSIFITHSNKIEIYGLSHHQKVGTITLNVSNWLDGMANDNNGYLYAVENAGKIHRVNLSTLEDTIIVAGGLPDHPQDIVFDEAENRLLLASWETNSYIVSISLENFEVTDLIETNSGQYDGIVMDTLRNIYVTSWLNGGRVYKWVYPWDTDPEVFSQGHAGPAGLAINNEDNCLAVPNFNSNSMDILTLFPVGIQEVKKNFIEIKNNEIVITSSAKTIARITSIQGKELCTLDVTPGQNCFRISDLPNIPKNQFVILSFYSEQSIISEKIYIHLVN